MSATVKQIRNAVAQALSPYDRVLLAVSGGRDSMAMLDAARHVSSRLLVATFDHRTGPTGAEAVRVVQRRCEQLDVECIVGQADVPRDTEAAWREQRWRFLRAAAARSSAVIATAHTLDDQIETVFIRALRDAGARGLAGLYATSDIVRPLLQTRRADVERYVAALSIEHTEDPTNQSRRHLRNRVRLDLLPAALAVRPALSDELLSIAQRAAEWRDRVAAVVDSLSVARHADGSLFIARGELEPYDERELAILWPEIAAHAGVTMDRRGTHRVAAFTSGGATGGSIQLSGGIEVVRTREHFVLRRKSR